MILRRSAWIVLIFSLSLGAGASVQDKEQQPVLGWIELAEFVDWGAVAKVKMDTGALSSSLHATDLEYFERKGTEWVRFKVKIKNQEGKKKWAQQTFERPVYRFVKVVSSNGEGSRRPSVLMKVCLGGKVYEEQFTLNDRSEMTYPVLLGRRTIEHLGFIDVTRTYTSRPQCKANAPVNTIEDRELSENIGI